MAIKKVLLQKQIEGVLHQIYPKTDATIVDYTKTVNGVDTVTTVAAELAALATAITTGDEANSAEVTALRDMITGLGDGESLQESFDTLKEIDTFLTQHQDSIGALAALLADVGKASVAESSAGAGDGVAATGLHADVEELEAAVTSLQEANGTNVSKTKTGADPAANGHLYLDGVDTTVYDDTDIWASAGRSTDAGAAAGTTAWSRIKNAESDIDTLEAGLGVATANADSAGTTAWSRIKNAESDIDTLEAGLGSSTDTAASDGTTAWSRIKALEAVEATKVEDGTSNGYIKVNGVDDAIQVYDDTDIWASAGRSTDTAAANGTTAWARIKNAETDVDALESEVGKLATATANASGTTAWSRILNAESDIDDLEAGLGTSADTAAAAGTTAWSRLKQAEADIDALESQMQVVLVSSMPATVDDNTLYMLEI